MTYPPSKIFYPASYQELFSVWSQNPTAVLFAGGTGWLREQTRQTFDLPPEILVLDDIEEMQRISRTERFLEIGAMVKLSQIIGLGKIVPIILRRCLESIAGPQLRTMATIGGNVCFPSNRLDSSAALSALDAQFELRTAQSSRWISASRFFSLPVAHVLEPQEILTRIKVPLDTWDYTAYRKFKWQSRQNRAVLFMIKTQKNILHDIKIVYKTDFIWRDRDSESILIGKQLPLSRRIASDFIQHWEEFLGGVQNIDDLSRQELISFLEVNVYNLSE